MATVLSRLRDLDSTPTLIVCIVVSLDKALYDDYLCLVASNKQQIQWYKRVQICSKYSATVAFS